MEQYIDSDIFDLLNQIEKGKHKIPFAMNLFIETMPGYQNHLHTRSTTKKYEYHLRKDTNSFYNYLVSVGVEVVEDISKENLLLFISSTMNRVDPQTARGYVTAIRQFLLFISKLGW